MKPPVRLVPDALSHDAIEAAEQLAQLARSGKIIGFSIAVLERGRKYWTNSAGETRRNPTWARGMVAALDDELADMVRQQRSGGGS